MAIDLSTKCHGFDGHFGKLRIAGTCSCDRSANGDPDAYLGTDPRRSGMECFRGARWFKHRH